MDEHSYSELQLKAQGQTLIVPAALFGVAVVGSALKIEPFASHLPWVVAAVAGISAVYFAIQFLKAEQNEVTLRINEKTLSFHSGGAPLTLFWREVFGVETGQAADPKTGILHERVLIIGRKAGTRQQDLETFAFDYHYGKSPAMLRDIVRKHWHEALEVSRLQQNALPPAPGGEPRTFGRRASDRI
jgi:hypothetical protein